MALGHAGGSALAAQPLAVAAVGLGEDADLLLAAERRLCEVDLERVAEIAAGDSRALLAKEIAEQIFEQLGEGVQAEAGVADAVPAAPVIARSLLGSGQDRVGLRNFFEDRLGLGIAGVLIGVMLEGEAAIGALELGGIAIAWDTEHLVIVAGRESRGL